MSLALGVVFFALAIATGIWGYKSADETATDVAKILAFVFIVLAIVSLLLSGGTAEQQSTATCVGDCGAVESVTAEPSPHITNAVTDVEVVFSEPVTASVVIYADGDPVTEEQLDGERLLATNVDDDHYNVTVDVHREGGGAR